MKRLALLSLAAAALTGTASAQTTMRITGSTAFRAATLTAIRNIITPATLEYAYVGSSFTGSSEAIFKGTPVGGAGQVFIKVSFSGSTGGLQTVVQNLTVSKWLKDTTVTSAAGTAYANEAALGPNPYDTPVTADVTMADTFQNSTDFKTPALVPNRVGVIVFQWVRNNGTPRRVSNMTPWLATNLLSGGTPLSLFTGVPADVGTMVLATGRDEESGTRTATFADCLFGSGSNPTQYQVVNNGTNVTDLIVWPATGPWPAGHSGYSGGGNLVTALNLPGSITSANPAHLVSYAGINDAANVNPSTPSAAATATVAGGAVTAVNVTVGGQNYGPGTTVVFSGGGGSGAAATAVTDANGVVTSINVTSGGTGYTSAPTVALRGGATLTWNGVPYSDAGVREGQYTFWSYEFLYYRTGYANAALAQQLANRIRLFDASVSGTKIGDMHVERAIEGGDVTPL
ncbi:MAG TPA: hypothetical protein VG796_26090 [Verrucomicrobiales bacterium]|nr:hypothetical protein [Verrucomicrobiales bacterium]